MPEGTSASASSSTEFELRFSVSDATEYSLTGEVLAYGVEILNLVLKTDETPVFEISVRDGEESFSRFARRVIESSPSRVPCETP